MRGFHHPEYGYWETISDVSDEFIAQYPDGTISVPLRPSPAHKWENGVWVEHADAVKPPAAPVPDLSFAQLLIGLVAEGWITQEDGEAWLRGILPPAVLATINLIPVGQQFAAKARATSPSVVLRNDPLVEMMALAQGRTAAELDAFFTTYSAV